MAAAQSGASGYEGTQALSAPWSSSEAVYLCGLTGITSKDRGTLALDGAALTFTTKSGYGNIPVASITAVGTDQQSVELWGMKGRILRMAMPDGAGLAAATVMHHKIHILTVEYRDSAGAYHAAVFLAAVNDADHLVQALARKSAAYPAVQVGSCQNAPLRAGSVLVSVPEWNDVNVPPSYRALVYERVIERLRAVKGIEHVYRDGELGAADGCAQFAIQLSLTSFKPGSQVVRASTGPVGFLVGTTQMKFGLTLTDSEGKLHLRNEIDATQRGEAEDLNVTDKVAKKVAKQLSIASKQG